MDYHGMKYRVTPRQTTGGLCFDAEVTDGFYRLVWCHTGSDQVGMESLCRRIIDNGKQPSGNVGTWYN